MIQFSSTNNKFSCTLQGDTASPDNLLYTLSRSMLRVKREVSPQVSIIFIYCADSNGVIVSNAFYTDPDGILEIPFKNIVNKYHNLSGWFAMRMDFLELDGTTADGSASLTFKTLQGVSDLDMLSPRQKECDNILLAYQHYIIMPPNVIYNPSGNTGILGQGVLVETNIQNYNKDVVWAYSINGIATTITPTGDRLNQLIVPPCDTLNYTDDDTAKYYNIENGDYCTTWAVIRWTSLTGCVRQHYFPVVAFINGVDDQLAVISAGDGYDVRKNIYKGVRCRITGLTSYGCWYYQDLLQASDAHALIQLPTGAGTFAYKIGLMNNAVSVEGGMEETPQGNGAYNFEFTLKLKHYDSF